jgi:phosphoglycolate phosphatase
MSWSAVLFDLDGTLLNTLEDLADSMNAVLRGHGFPEHPVDAYRYFVGEGTEELVRRTLPSDALGAELMHRYLLDLEAEYGRRWAIKTRPYPGIPEMLDALEAQGLPKAVLSNKPDPFTRLTVARLLDPWRFHPVRGARPGVPRKPDPTGALAIAAELGTAPAACLYVGDTSTDMQTATAAGMYPVGATWGFRPAEELTDSGARRLIDHPAHLLELL